MYFFNYVIISILPVVLGNKICGTDLPEVDLDQCCSFEDGTRNNTQEDCLEGLNPAYDIVDKKNGIVEFSFDLKHIRCVRDIKLFVEDIEKNECEEKTDDPFFENSDTALHTTMEHTTLIQNHTCTKCEKIAKIYFSYVFSGCYHIEINDDYVIKNKYIETDYKKVTIQVGNFTRDYRPKTKELIINFFHELFKMNYLNLKLIYTLLNNTQENSVKFVIYDTDLSTTNENERLEVCRENDIDFDNDIDSPVCDYQADTTTLRCIYHNISEGIYEFVYHMENEPVRCRRYSVWNDDSLQRKDQCKWNFVVNLQNKTEPVVTDDGDSIGLGKPILIILIIIFVIFGALVISTGFYLKRGTRGSWFSVPMTDDIGTGSIKKKKIFLLYAKDCKEFMDMMSSFRVLLTEIFEVYDMYDKKFAGDIVADSDGWICDKLLKCKTIVILNKSADLNNKQGDNADNLYKIPSGEDNYFLYALKNLRKDNENYEKLHVVDFECDTADYESFRYINTYARYTLPRQLSNIMATLSHRDYEKLKHEDNFIKKYKIFENYQKNNPNYLEQIINVQV